MTNTSRPLTIAVTLLLPLTALALGFASQSLLDQGNEVGIAGALYVAAALIFGLAMWRQRIEAEIKTLTGGTPNRLNLPLLALSFAVAAIAFDQSSDNQFRPIGVMSWFASIIAFLLAVSKGVRFSSLWIRLRGSMSSQEAKVRWEVFAVVTITALGAFYRFFKLDAILAEMGPDLPLKFRNVQEILQGNYLIFFPAYPGREGLFFYWTAIFANAFGNSHLTIKFSSALIGTLTIPVAYSVVKFLFNSEVGLYAALLLALSHWHIILSRIGFRSILTPLFVLVMIFLIVRALKKRRDFDYALAGLWLGLGLHTYSAWLVAPVATVVALATSGLAHRNVGIKMLVRSVAIVAVAAFLVWLPLARYAYENPDLYLMRVESRMTGVEQPLPPNLVGVVLDNVERTFMMLNYRGDPVYVQNVPNMRELGFVTGVLFILGLGYTVAHWRHGANAVLLSFFAVMLLPSALSIAFPLEVPDEVRASGGIAMAILIAALPFPLLRARIAEMVPRVQTRVANRLSRRGEEVGNNRNRNLNTGWVVPAFALILLVGEARDSFRTYFVEYVNAQPGQNYSISLELARALSDFDGNGPAFVKIWPYWYDGNALRVQMGAMAGDWHGELDHFDANQPPFANFRGKALFLVNPQDTQALEFLRSFFPNGVAIEHSDSAGTPEFISYYAEKD